MGAVCCVAAKNKTVNGSPREVMQRHARYSPSWSFRRDHRGRVAGEEMPSNWLSGGSAGTSRLYVKPNVSIENTLTSGEGCPANNSCSIILKNSSASEGITGIPSLLSNDEATSGSLLEVKESTEFPSSLLTSPVKLSPSAHSVSSQLASPLSSESKLLHSNLTSHQCSRSPGHLLSRQVSNSQIPGYKSPTLSISEEASSPVPSTWINDYKRVSNGVSPDSLPIPAFSESIPNQKDRWSFERETSGLSLDKSTRSFGVNPGSPLDLQTCGVCVKLLTQRSSVQWRSHISSNELAVVSVLTCGHVYHADCLEDMTPEINKYDPDCPVCVLGEKRVMKMSEKAIKAELDLKARKRFKKCVSNKDSEFDWRKNCGVERRAPKMSSSLSLKSSPGKPFMQRHFSFGFKIQKSMSENQSTRTKGISWGRSSKD